MKNITIHQLAIEEIVHHSRSKLPEESCGILLGKDGNITDILIMENLATKINKINQYSCPYDNTEGFRFNEFRAWKAVEEAAKHGLEFLGIWHSHPHLNTNLTDDDIEGMMAGINQPISEECYYLIAGVTDSDYTIKVWQWDAPSKDFVEIYK